ncbi:autotransporter-associated beta strand repeat-containing protein [Achromobacter ruhlandii]|uniref:autotransporter-associated beta strand repeat-containing protein n=2 Tax=Achromobacter ruhlandii TaxID=72557 RepID=UPI0018D292BE|nr:autotransporter-associated beta strand repeat-containing protein [Achromobacter ruhlandii]
MPGHAACTPFRLHATTAALCAVMAFAGAVPDVLAAGPEEEGAPADVPMAEDGTDGVAIRLTGGARQVKLEPGGGIEGDIVLSHDDKTLTPPKLSILNSGDQSVRVTGGLDVGTGAEVGFAGNPLGLDGNVTLHDGSALVLRGALQRETPAASFSAGKVFLGQDVTLSLSGIAHRIVRDAPLFSAAGGIEGDFARLMSDGYERRVDYLTLTTRKSEDQTRYLADYDLTWLDTGGRSHGTFTIGADLSDTIGADLHDMAANGATGWDGRSLTKRGTGALTLTGDSTYTGGTTVAEGTLRIGDGGLTGSVTGNIRNNAALVFDRGNELLHAGVISGVGTVTKQGAGTLTLTGNNTYTGLTSVDAGTLRIGAGGTTGVVAGDIANQATLVFDRGDTATYAGVISGEGAMIKKGTSTLILTGDNTYTGPTTIEGGALYIGNGGATGSLAGDIANAGTLVFDRGNALTYTGLISGPGAVSKIGADAVNLAGANTYDGDTTVGAGTLEFGRALGAANTLGGGITVAGGATLAIHTPATVDMAGAAVLNDGASLSITTARAAEGEPPESWRVKAVTIGNGVTFNLSGVAAASATDTALFSATDGVIEGDFARVFIGGKADDGDAAAPGVRITDFLTLRTRKSDDGRSYLASYQLSWFDTPARAHGTFLLGADEEFDIGATLRRMRANGDWDGNSLTKRGAGTLILSGDNSYFGLTTVEAGTLRVGYGGGTGSVNGDIVNRGEVVFDRGNGLTYPGVISGDGVVTQAGSGTLTLTGANTYSGGTRILGSTLRIGDGGATGSVAGDIFNDGGQLFFARGDDVIYDGVISGTGSVFKGYTFDDGVQYGAGTLTLTGDHTYTGRTTVIAGTLRIGDGGATGSLAGNVLNSAALVFDRADAASYAGIISGVGTVTKRGTNTLTLTGENTHSGQTLVEGGVLRLGDGGLTGSVAGPVLLSGDAALHFDHGRTWRDTYDNVISGSGSVTLTNGMLILTGDNTYTGGTRISNRDSTLFVGYNGTSGSVAGDIVNDGGKLFFVRSDDATYDGVISGTGEVYKGYTVNASPRGDGTLTLTGDHTYTGRTALVAGTLRLGDGGVTGSIAGNILNNAALAFDRSDPVTYAGVISGGGRVAKDGDNVLTLTGGNTYTGVTTINAGTLRIGDGGATGAVRGDIVNHAELVYDRSGAVTYAGAISGEGTVTKKGTNTLTLTGNNTYTGLTTLEGGTLRIGNGGTTGFVTGDIASAATVIFDRSDAVTYSSAMSGTGALVKNGAEVLTLTGANTYGGDTRVTAGTLKFGDGASAAANTLGGGMTVASGATLDIHTPVAVNLAGMASLRDGSALMLRDALRNPASAVSLTAGKVTLGADVTLLVSGIADQIRRSVSLFETDGGIEGDFARVIFDGYERKVDYLTLAASKSEDLMRYLATYDLSWLDESGQAHGTFTLDPGVADTVDADLHDMAANGATGWDGRSLTKQGSGTLTLTGAGTYTGGTTIAAGTLRIGDGGVSGSVTGDILNHATLVFDRADAAAHAGVIAGEGSVTKRGAGTLTLTGNNVYTGRTFIEAGTLRVGDGGTTGAVAGDIANDAALVFEHGDAMSYAGVISGSGTVINKGTGTLTLTGNSTYGGPTRIEAGTLRIGDGGTAGAVAGDIANDATLVFERGDAVSYAGVISGVGTVTKKGSNTLTLTGNSTYSGPTRIEAGTLRVGNGGTAGAVAGDIANDAALVFERGDAVSYAGVISGSGTVTKKGSNTLTLTGNSTYGGPTRIEAGTLRIGDGGTAGAVAGDIANDAALVFERGDAVSYAGVISGVGTVTKKGSNTLTLSGNSTYSGPTRIEAGALRIGDGGTTGAVAGDIANDATLVFERGDAATYAGVISGSGAVTNKGTGTLTLTGNNIYTGLTTVEAGTLRIGDGGNTGSLAGDIVNHGILAFERGDDVTYGRLVSGTGALVKNGTNTLTLGGANTYSGATRIEAGTLKTGVVNAFARTAGVMIARDASLNLGGYSQIISQLDNSGVILFNDLGAPVSMAGLTVAGNMKHSGMLVLNTCADCAGQVYTQAGDWVGDGGTVSFGAVLGGDDSVTDKLIIGGAATGTTYVTVANEGGAGAQTVEGIELIRTAGSTEDAFVQRGRIAAGAYDYFLRKGSASGNSPNSWYLTSLDMTPEPPPENPEPPTENPEVPPADDGAQIPEVPPSEDDAQVPELPPADDGAQVPEEPPSDDGAQNPELPPVDDGAQDPEVPQVDGGAQDPEVPPVDDGADPADPPPGADTAEPADPPVDDKADLPDGPADTPPGGNSEGNANAVRVFRPEIGSYASNLAAASVLFNTSLSDRESGEAVDPVTGARRHAWARTAAGRSHGNMSDGQNQFSADRSVLQMGSAIAGGTFTGKDGWRLGVMAGYGNQHSKTRSRLSGYQSRGAVEGYSAGLYGTWYQDALTHRGLYVDGWALYNRFDNTVKGDGLAKETYQSQGVTASLESGLLLEAGSYTTDGGMENRFRFQPQVQVLWSGVKAADHTERTGTRVQGMGANNVQTRLGARLSISSGHRSRGPGKAGTFETFLEANWLHASKQYGVMLDGVGATILGNRNVAELKAGVEGQLTERLGVSASLTRRQGGQGLRATQGALTLTLRF